MSLSVDVTAYCYYGNAMLKCKTNNEMKYKRIGSIQIGDEIETECSGIKKVKYVFRKSINNKKIQWVQNI